MRTLALSLLVLGATAIFQLVVVVLSGSVALLADSVHNIGDALTAVPLAIAFVLLRRPPSRRLTYGWGRAEDFAGLVVVLIILFSAVYAAYEAIDRLFDPQAPSYLLATAIAGVGLGFPMADPIVGLLISLAILRIVWQSARPIGLRAMDGIEPQILDAIRHETEHVPGVRAVRASARDGSATPSTRR
jgi:divalent metal cation (Fe/Co/Zn/Cd) transporter